MQIVVAISQQKDRKKDMLIIQEHLKFLEEKKLHYVG
jgi:hypothetical protein